MPRLALALAVLALAYGLGVALTSESWRDVITAVGWVAVLGAIVLDPVLGLSIWVIVSPYAPFIHLNLSLGAGIPDLSLDRLAAGFFCIVLVAQAARRKWSLAPFTWLDTAVVAYAAALTLSARTAQRGTLTALQGIFDLHLVPVLIYFLAKNVVRDGKAMRQVIGALGIIAGYLALLTVHEHVTGNALFIIYGRVSVYGDSLTRVNSLLQNPAYIALALNLVLPFVVRAALQASDKLMRWLYGLAVLALLGTVFSLYNRAGWLGALLVIVVSSAYYPRLRRWVLLALVIIAPVAAISWQIVSSSAIFAERLTYGLSVDYRVRAMNAVWQLVSRQVVFGIGFGNFSILSLSEGLMTKYTTNYWVPTTHNSYFDVFVSSGLSGLAPFIAAFLLIARESWLLYRKATAEPSIDRSLIVALAAAFVAFAASIATFDLAATPFCAMLFCLIVGSVLGSQNWPISWGRRVTQRREDT